jgi:glycerol kinase
VFGLTLASTRAHLVRATLEGVAHQVDDVMDSMAKDAGVPLELIRVDGGPSQNDLLMQIQADILGIPVEVATMEEATAFGVGAMAGVARGWWEPAAIEAAWRPRRRFLPRISEAERRAKRRVWAEAVEQVRAWAPPPGGDSPLRSGSTPE